MRAAWLVVACCAVVATSARASTWIDRPLDDMVRTSDVIVVGEVVDPGDENACRMRVVEVLKGDPPAVIGVAGFNDRQSASSRLLRVGERFLLLLHTPQAALSSWGSGSGPGMAAYAPRPSTWVLPTPSSGDYPIDGHGLHGDPFQSRGPEDDDAAAPVIALEVVRLLVTGAPSSLLSSQLAGLAERLRALDEASTEKSKRARQTALWLLYAAHRVDDPSLHLELAGVEAMKRRDPRLVLAGPSLLRDAAALVAIVDDDRFDGRVRAAAAFGAARRGAGDDLANAVVGALDDEGADVGGLVGSVVVSGHVEPLRPWLRARAPALAKGFAGDGAVVDALLLLHDASIRDDVIAAADAGGARVGMRHELRSLQRYLLHDGDAASLDAVARLLERSSRRFEGVELLSAFACAAPTHPALPRLIRAHLATDHVPPLAAIFLTDDVAALELLGARMPDVAGALGALMTAVRGQQGRARVDALIGVLDHELGARIAAAVFVELVRRVEPGDEARVVAALRATQQRRWWDTDAWLATLAAWQVAPDGEEREWRRWRQPLLFPVPARPRSAPDAPHASANTVHNPG